ncbi:MAG: DHH family phosphoesterase [Chloroflexota bacterium]|nr:DHH family phosphoesterase [Chloroflexota bacterium]
MANIPSTPNLRDLNRVYVIGHVNPDTDAIASAMGYAWLLEQRDGINAIAARSGAINRQTSWVLHTLNLEPPMLFNDASPRFDSVMRRLDTVTPDRPLSEAWAILSRTGGVAPVVNPDGTPYGLISGRSLFNFLSRHMGPHPRYKDMTIAELLEIPCKEAAETDVARYPASTRIRDVIRRLLRDEVDEFWVLDDNQRYLGICRQRDLLDPPRLKIILVDHNEPQQALGSLNEAELVEILDHHRLGNPTTHEPIRFTVDVVGSTSTLVSEMIEDAGLSSPPELAGLMLAGLVSDTLILTSPTTTARDHKAAERLSRWAFVYGSPLADETVQSFGEKVLSAGAGLSSRDPKDVVSTDMKQYETGSTRFAIAQAEVSELYELNEHLEPLRDALQELRERRSLDFAMLMVTDVVQGDSRLLMVDAPLVLEELPYRPLPDGTRLAEGVVSRKKQLLPVVFSLLED